MKLPTSIPILVSAQWAAWYLGLAHILPPAPVANVFYWYQCSLFFFINIQSTVPDCLGYSPQYSTMTRFNSPTQATSR